MQEPDDLSRMADFLYGNGVHLDGCELEEKAAMAEVRRRYPHKPFCLVRRWMLVDLLVAEQTLTGIQASGRLPLLVFAHEVVFDSAGRFAPGDWVRSSLCITCPEDGFFETGNTVYVLLGDGCTKQADYKLLFSIH
ncbi:hypothetical protein KRX52_06200 [Pseudomonas sp. MAP12]|uniref:DUF6957 domain-containing protein n=1 Tax=Geopseudomonas aromaticivorans TaxID=2849492 RepID=A0ABS6MUB0_9GAMM|nr:hypothetical protein [Pseudomonas aromaticivorans]MBV2132393.1 hypothetical protein [Pseudomonas aromaticivorans]